MAGKGTTGKGGSGKGTKKAARRAAPRRAAPKRRAPKKVAAPEEQVESGAEGVEEDPPENPAARSPLDSLGDFADKAARQIGDFVDKARVKAGPTAEKVTQETKKVAVDLGKGWDEAFGTIRTQAKDLMAKGQHTKVRIKFRDRVLAELPIAAVAAAEVASWAAFGPFRLVIGHLVGRAVLDVEFISNADSHVAEGRAWLADGEMEKALAAFDKALTIDRKSAGAHLGRGLALKLRGDKPGAKESFLKAEECDPHGETGREARRHLDNLGI
jgi:tetratricopeptide (TPR) repeat protein